MKSLKKKVRIYISILSIALFITSCSDNEISNSQKNHLIIIGVDAMSPNGIINAYTPNLDQMMKEGSFTLTARGVLPTSSSTNWASMVSGSGPEQHGVISNGWERDEHSLPPNIKGIEDIFPTIFGITRQQRPNIEMGVIYTWGGFGRLIERSALNYDVTEKTDDLTTQKAKDYIIEKNPDFLFIHLDNVDHVGHSQGHKTQPYYEAVADADHLIGTIVQATKEAGIFENTTFIISADHGGIGYGHGGETLDEIQIPFILYGKNIKKGYKIKNQVYTYDNASTAARILGIKQPQAWIGRSVETAFIGNPDGEQNHQNETLLAPLIYPLPKLYDLSGGLYIDQNAVVKMETKEKAEIRYTIDGSMPNRNSILYNGSFNIKKSAVVMAKAFDDNGQESGVSKAFYRLVKSNSKNGILYKYYESKSEMNFLPNFDRMKSIKKGLTYEFRINKINNVKYQFGIRYEAYIEIDIEGAYRFYLNSDDGSRLYINDELIVDNDGGHGTIERMGKINLKEGKHKIVIDYHNQKGGAWLDASYKGPNIPKQIIPAHKLFYKK